MKTIIVKVNDAVKTVAEHQVVTKDGQPTVIKAVNRVNYELVDQATGRAPDHIITKRVGKDLHVSVEENGQDSDLIIEGYYEESDSALIGLAEDGSYYYYVPDTGEVADFVTELAPGAVEGQALGGNAYSTPWWVGATDQAGFGILPWLVGLAGLGALIAALNDDDDDKSSTPAPAPEKAPIVITDKHNNPDENGDGIADSTTITGTAEPGSEITVVDKNGNVIGKTKADEKGNFEITTDRVLENGEDYDVISKEGDTVIDTETVTGDNTAPGTPNLIANEDGSVTVVPGKDADDLKVDFTDEDGNAQTVEIVKDPETGKWVSKDGKALPDGVTLDSESGKITLSPDAVEDGSKVTAENTDELGNKSSAETTAGNDLINPPTTPDLVANPDGSVEMTPSDDAIKGKVEFTDEKGQDQTVEITKDPETGKWESEGDLPPGVTIDPDTGKVTIEPDAVKDGSTVGAENSNEGGSSSAETTAGNDVKPGAPDLVAKDDGSVEMTPSKDADKGKAEYTDEEGNDKTVEIEKGEDGTWAPVEGTELPPGVTVDPETGKVTIPPEAVEDGSKVEAENSNDNGSSKSEVTAGDNDVNTDDVGPNAPAMVSNPDGSVEMTPSEDATKGKVDFTDENGQEQTVNIEKDPNTGKWESEGDLPPGVSVDPDTGKVTIAPDAVKDGSQVKGENSNDNGNAGSEVTAGFDLPPGAPVLDSKDDGAVEMTPSDDATDATVDFTDENDQPQKVEIEKDPITGEWTPKDGTELPPGVTVDPETGKVTIEPDAVKDGSKVEAENSNGNGSSSSETTAGNDNNVDTTPPATPIIEAKDDGSVTVTPDNEDAVELTVDFIDEEGTEQKVELEKTGEGENATWGPKEGTELPPGVTVDPKTGEVEIHYDAIKDGSTIKAENSDEAGNTSSSESVASRDPVNGPTVEIATGEDGYVDPSDLNEDGTVNVEIGFIDDTIKAGDTLVVTGPDGQPVEVILTEEDITNGSVTVPVKPAESGTNTTVVVEVKNPANEVIGSGSDSAPTDFGIPGDTNGDGVVDDNDDDATTKDGAPIITFPEDKDGNGILSVDENGDTKDTTPVQISTPAKTEAGDTVVVTINGVEQEVVVTAADLANGYVTVDAPVVADADGKVADIEVEAYVKDNAGNQSNTAKESLAVDLIAPGDTNGDGVVDDVPVVTVPEAKDGINAEELTDGVQTEVTIPKGTEAGDKITLTVTNPDGTTSTVEHPVTQVEVDAGTAEVTIPKDQVPTDGDYKVVAEITDPAGNTSGPSSPTDFTVDTAAPTADDTTVVVNDITDDNIINAEEADGYVPVTGTVTGEFNEGDEVIIIVNNKPYKGTLDADGNFEIPVKGSDLVTDSDTKVEVVVKPSDDSGNIGEITADKEYAIDTQQPSAPTVEASTQLGDGSVKVTPPTDQDVSSVKITYTDENGQQQVVTGVKDPNTGEWSIDNPPAGVTVDKDSGVVTLDEDAVKDGSTVTATATDTADNVSDPDSDVAGKDDLPTPKVTIMDGDDGVINGNDLVDGDVSVVVWLPEEAKEGDVLTFNGEKTILTQSMINKGFVEQSIVLTEDDKANRVELTAEATITYGGESGVVSPKGVDTSTIGDLIVPGDTNGDGKADTGPVITFLEDKNKDGTLQFTENTDKPESTDVRIDVPEGSEVGDILYITVNGEDQAPITITQDIIDNGYILQDVPVDKFVDGNPNDDDDTVNDIKVDAYVQEPTVDGIEGAKSLTTSKVLDVELRPASSITNMSLEDNFTDEYDDVETLYDDVNNYVGEVKNQPLGETATGLNNGLTNDATPTLNFTLDSPLLANQEIVITRYTLTAGTEGDAEVIELPADATVDGLKYTFTESEMLPETYGQDYRYKVEIKTDGETVATRKFDFHLDTLVEALSVVSANVDARESQQLVLTTAGTSEIGGSITYSYPTGAGVEERTVTIADNGTFTLDLTGFNRFSNQGLTYTFIDAAGNASDTKTLFLRNMFSQISAEVGPDPSADPFTLPNNGGFDDSNIIAALQPVTNGSNNGFVSTDGNDNFIIGIDYFGNTGLTNGSVAGASGNINALPFLFETGAGDDHILVRGDLQSFLSDDAKVSMGTGNDKFEVNGNIVIGTYNVDMGEGDNIIHIKGTTVDATNLNFDYGNGNDLLRIDQTTDGTLKVNFGDGQNKLVARTFKLDPKSIVNFGKDDDIFLTSGDVYGNGASINMGDGNNTVKVGGSFQTNFADDQASAQLATVNTGIGNDVFRINGNASMHIDSGAGEDSIRIDNNFRKGTIISGAKASDSVASDNDYVRIDGNFNATSINTAAEEGYQGTDDDIVRIGGNADGNITTGGGTDTIQIGGTYRGNIDSNSGDNTITIGSTFREGSITTGDGVDIIQIDGSMSTGGTLAARPIIDTGAGDDIITLKGAVIRADINMGEGNDTLILGSNIYNGDSGNNGRIDMGAGDTDTVMLTGGNVQYYARHFKNVDIFDMTEDTKQTLTLKIDDILNDDVKQLFIKGDDLDVVDLGGSANSLVDNAVGRENGVWSQKNELHTDTEGNIYHAYIFTGNNGGVNDEIVYIQDTITVI